MAPKQKATDGGPSSSNKSSSAHGNSHSNSEGRSHANGNSSERGGGSSAAHERASSSSNANNNSSNAAAGSSSGAGSGLANGTGGGSSHTEKGGSSSHAGGSGTIGSGTKRKAESPLITVSGNESDTYPFFLLHLQLTVCSCQTSPSGSKLWMCLQFNMVLTSGTSLAFLILRLLCDIVHPDSHHFPQTIMNYYGNTKYQQPGRFQRVGCVSAAPVLPLEPPQTKIQDSWSLGYRGHHPLEQHFCPGGRFRRLLSLCRQAPS